MQAQFDSVGSSIFFGILLLAVAQVRGNLNSTLFETTSTTQTQHFAVQVARQIEFDFSKIGYRVRAGKILRADSTSITFKGDLGNNGVVDSVRYSIGSLNEAQHSTNPRDFPLKRFARTEGENVQLFGMTHFRIAYYDSAQNRLSVPMTTDAQLQKVRAIQVTFGLESSEPVATSLGMAYASVGWEKMIYPRNLNN
jgi:hypothetical protein